MIITRALYLMPKPVLISIGGLYMPHITTELFSKNPVMSLQLPPMLQGQAGGALLRPAHTGSLVRR